MKIALIRPVGGFMDVIVPELEKLGVEVTDTVNPDTDFLVGLSVSVQDRIWHEHLNAPDLPMVNYNWDIYEWVWTHPRGKDYDWNKYGELLGRSLEVWCPSDCTIDRMKEWYGHTNGYKILSFARLFEPMEYDIKDGWYVLEPMREIPDRNEGWGARACKELGIKHVKPEHSLSEEDFRKAIAGATLLICPLYEASTGGLSLIEGYRLGKPVLVSDSPYMGASDYFGGRANYFDYTSYEDFKAKLWDLYENTPKLDIVDTVKFTDRYKPEVMARAMRKRLLELKRKEENK